MVPAHDREGFDIEPPNCSMRVVMARAERTG
jgi:hypothetical protein